MLIGFIYTQTLILVNLIVVNLFSYFSTLLETVAFVYDHRWTQDSPMFPLTFGGKTEPISVKEGQHLRFEIIKTIQAFNDY